MAFYIGVDGVAKEVKAAYIGVNNTAKKIKNGYLGVNGVAKKFYSDVETAPFATATDEQIATMLAAHYAGFLNIANYWHVGDTRQVNLTAMSKGSVNESHVAQPTVLTIIGINHDDLAYSTGDKTKAALTLQCSDCLKEGGYYTAYSSNTTTQRNMCWDNSSRRSWCNSTFKEAIPEGLRSLIKPVTKKTGAGYNSAVTVLNTSTEYAFLLSEFEVTGVCTKSVAGEGTQYAYYNDSTNWNKGLYGSTDGTFWLFRSRVNMNTGGSTSNDCIGMNSYGVWNQDGPNVDYQPICYYDNSDAWGIAPAFCI